MIRGPIFWKFNLLDFARFPLKVNFSGLCVGKYGFGVIKKVKAEEPKKAPGYHVPEETEDDPYLRWQNH
jgi:hypothetical protein